MKRRSLLIVVALLCMASLMAAMAFTTATVTNAADLSIVNTSEALLKLTANDISKVGLKDGSAIVDDNGDLVFNFNLGKDNEEYGLQRNSEYVWFNEESGNNYGLFKVYNQTKEHLNINLKAENVPTGVNIYAIRCYNGGVSSEWELISDSDGYTCSNWNPGANNHFGIKIEVTDLAVKNTVAENMSILVTGTAYQAPVRN